MGIDLSHELCDNVLFSNRRLLHLYRETVKREESEGEREERRGWRVLT